MSLAFDPPVPADAGVSRGEAFEALANQRRRHVVRALSGDTAGTVELRPLSLRVAALENGKPTEEVTPDERRRVYNALQQFHLPKLDETGVVDYDSRRGTVTPTEGLARLETYLALPRRGRRWCRSVLLLGAGVTAVFAAALVATPPLTPVPGAAIGAALAALVTAAAGAVLAARGRPAAPAELEDRTP